MKKKVFGRKLSRESDTRLALFRNLTISLVEHGKIRTTKAKALAITPFAEKVLRLAMDKNSLNVRRKLYSMLANKKSIVDSLIAKVDSEFGKKNRLTSIVNLPDRKGDSAKVAILSVIKGVFSENKIEKSKSESVEKTEKKTETKKPVKVQKAKTKKSK